MVDDKKIGKALGVDTPIDEAFRRFAEATKEELDRDPSAVMAAVIQDGEADLVAFKGAKIRKVFHRSEWHFSLVDVMQALTDTTNPRRYWSDLKAKMLKDEGFELYDEIVQLPLEAEDGKLRETDTCNVETLFRVIQSVPSPKAEPFKRWLAKVAYERIEEIQDPEIAIKRAIMSYQLQGRSMDWIEQRVRSIMVRKELTNEWQKRGVTDTNEFAILTGVLSTRTFGVTPTAHKELKRLERNHNLRDHMTDLELILTQLAEKSTKEIAQIRDAQGFEQNKKAARAGGDIAGNARRSIESQTGRKVVSTANFLPKRERNVPLDKPQ
jgi:DNA-damage-inducible protein D